MIDIATQAIGDESTIAALATSSGRGAIGMIRVSGPQVTALASRLLAPVPRTPRHATLCRVRDLRGEVLDEALCVLYPAPHSYTGEDVLEVSVHGGLVVPRRVLAAFLEAGARLAEPGEFTRRAVLNGKLDLLQAEAVGDLIDARSTAAHRQSLRQLDGGLSRLLLKLREQLLDVESMLAYDIDFPEEDDGPIPRQRIVAAATALQDVLERLVATASRGGLIHEGALVVLAGAPNVGKSSLFNALLGERRAIVTEIAGTTRDAIEAVLDLPSIPIRLVDTAGLRKTGDVIEQLGIETTERYLQHAAVVLACVTPDTAQETTTALAGLPADAVLVVGMKADLVSKGYESTPSICVSAETREGLDTLLEQIEARLTGRYGADDGEMPVLTRARHQALVREALTEVQSFLVAWNDEELPAPIAATHIRAAANALAEMVGVIHVDDVLDVLFRSFCVGK